MPAGSVSVACFYKVKEMDWIRYFLDLPFVVLGVSAAVFVSGGFGL